APRMSKRRPTLRFVEAVSSYVLDDVDGSGERRARAGALVAEEDALRTEGGIGGDLHEQRESGDRTWVGIARYRIGHGPGVGNGHLDAAAIEADVRQWGSRYRVRCEHHRVALTSGNLGRDHRGVAQQVHRLVYGVHHRLASIGVEDW